MSPTVVLPGLLWPNAGAHGLLDGLPQPTLERWLAVGACRRESPRSYRETLAAVLGPAPAPRFTGQTAWRALVPLDAPALPEVRVFLGSGRHLVAYPLRDGRLMNLVAVEERSDWTEEGWSHPDDPARMRAAFDGFMTDIS